MALTYYSSPQAYTPAYNDQTIVYSSDQVVVADFKYIVLVEVNGGTVFSNEILPRPDGYLVYDPREIVQNYITRVYFNPTCVTCEYANGKSCSVSVTVKEYYSGAVQTTSNVSYIAFDACLNDDDFRAYNYLNYVSASTNVKLLSSVNLEYNNPEILADVKNDIWIHFFRNNCTSIRLRVYNQLAVLQGTITLSIPTTNNFIYYANIGYKTLVANGYTPLDGWYVEVAILNSTTVYYSSTYTFTDLHTKYDKYTVQYLKRNGNIQRFNFEMISSITVNKKDNTVRLNPKRLNSGIYSSNSWDAEVKTVSTKSTKQIVLNTNWITPEQLDALEELWDSPVKWIVDSNNVYKSFTLTDSSMSMNKGFTDPLISMKITCEYDVQETRQRGL